MDILNERREKTAYGKFFYFLINLFNISCDPILISKRLQIRIAADQHNLLKLPVLKPPETRHLFSGADAAAEGGTF